MFTRNSIVLSNNIKTPLTAISRAIGNILQLTYGQLVKQLFSNQEQGFAYDPNDLTTLYQDAAGTIPVTAAGQPVGLMMDKSKGLVLGSERVAGGDFENGLAATKEDSLGSVSTWELNSSSPISGTQDGKLSITASASGRPLLYFTTPSRVLGGLYEISFDYKVTSGEATILGIYNGVATQIVNEKLTGQGKFKKRYTALAAVAGDFIYFGNTLCVIQIDNVSVKQVLGNHAYQTVSASRPIFQQTPILGNELVVNGDFTDTTKFTKEPGWTVSGGNGVASGVVGNISQSVQSTIGKTYLISGEVLSRTVGSVRLLADGTNVPIVTTTTPKVFSYIVTASLATIGIGFRSIDGFTGTVDNLSVKEVTGYRTDQNYLSFDGVDDFLQTNSIDFTATDKVSLFAGVRKLSDANIGAVFGLSSAPTSTSGVFEMYTPQAVGGEGVAYYSRGASTRSVVLTQGFKAPTSFILSAKTDIANNTVICKINQSLATVATGNLGGGSFSNNPLFIGRRGGTSFPFNGHLYSLIGIGRLTADSENITLEKAIAKNTGVPLNA